MPLIDMIRNAMINGTPLNLDLDLELNQILPGLRPVYLHPLSNGVRVDLEAPGEQAPILWLPWTQGELRSLMPYWVAQAPPGTVFLTYYLTGCKLFAIYGGPTFHIDSEMTVAEFWPQIVGTEWVDANWPVGRSQNVAYLYRAGQPGRFWNLASQLQGPPPTTYGNGDNTGMALVGGVLNSSRQIDLYYQTSPWMPLAFSAQQRLE